MSRGLDTGVSRSPVQRIRNGSRGKLAEGARVGTVAGTVDTGTHLRYPSLLPLRPSRQGDREPMLVVANGAFKSGSTWLFRVVREILPFQEIPPAYRHPYMPRSISPARLRRFLQREDIRRCHFVTKNHIARRSLRDLLLAHDEVRVLDIQRDLRDVLVSHYHHMRRPGRVKGDFSSYYWSVGRYKAQQLLRYHGLWAVDSPRVHVASFNGLKTRFRDEVKAMGSFLGVALGDERIGEIREATSLGRLREEWGEAGKGEEERFFRKGGTGDWRDYLDQEMLRDLSTIQEEGLRGMDRLRYGLLLEVRPRLKQLITERTRRFETLLARV